MSASLQKLKSILVDIYSEADIEALIQEVEGLGQALQKTKSAGENGYDALSEKDINLICYANSITKEGETPLASLNSFIKKYDLGNYLPNVHLLPFFPWDTDRGFSVKDYYKVDPENGDWDDIAELSKTVNLMFDFVANHASLDNPIVQKALLANHLGEEDPEYQECIHYKDYVITYSKENLPSEEELKSISRPRPNPVLSSYKVLSLQGEKRAVLGEVQSGEEVLGSGYVWTTFSREKAADGTEETKQVDLNFENPKVFLESVKIMFFYIEQAATQIRLDAIGYIWKKLGSISIHEPECHRILEAFNLILKIYAPQVLTISEVNERQSNAFKYIGTEEQPEADISYQFTHFPLAIHAVLFKSAYFYNSWLRTIPEFEGRQFTTVLGSHDGLGLKPLRGMLPKAEIEKLSETLVEKHGGLPNYAILPGGKKIIYEICATPWCLINNLKESEDFETRLKRYMAVVSLGLAIPGIPAFYINGLVASKNYDPAEGLDENRTTNREIFNYDELCQVLDDSDSEMSRAFNAIKDLISARQKQVAFNSRSKLRVLDTEADSCVAFALVTENEADKLIQLVNVSDQEEEVTLYLNKSSHNLTSILAEKEYRPTSDNSVILNLEPYEVCWFKRD